MKPREIFYGLGLRPHARCFGFHVTHVDLGNEGNIDFAVWDHPRYKLPHFQPRCVDALREFLSPGDFAVDVGAHVGDSTLPIALAVGVTGGVFGLEPNPYVYGVLQANAALNSTKTRIYPVMFAAMPEDGEYEFQYSDPGFCNGGLHAGVGKWQHSHFFKLHVCGRNFMTYLKQSYPTVLPKIRYIKIDAEGADPVVAKSMSDLLSTNRPYLKSEIYKHLSPDRRIAYFRWLRGLGYVVHRWKSDEDYFGPVLTEQDMQRWRHFDIFAVPGEFH